MQRPDFEAAKQYILSRLEYDLPKNFVYHSPTHTRDVVIPAIEYLASHEGIPAPDLTLLQTGAYYHDIGFVESYHNHELNGIRIACETLPRFGYTPTQIEIVSGIILATRLPQSPKNHLEEIMADADLDVLGRDDFWALNQLLRAESAAYGAAVTDAAWYQRQLEFMEAHHYFTPTAINLRSAKKQEHIRELMLKLEIARGQNNEIAK